MISRNHHLVLEHAHWELVGALLEPQGFRSEPSGLPPQGREWAWLVQRSVSKPGTVLAQKGRATSFLWRWRKGARSQPTSENWETESLQTLPEAGTVTHMASSPSAFHCHRKPLVPVPIF